MDICPFNAMTKVFPSKEEAIKAWNTRQERSGLRVEKKICNQDYWLEEGIKRGTEIGMQKMYDQLKKQGFLSPQGLKPLSEEFNNYKHALLAKIPMQITIPAFGKPPETVEYSEWRYWQGRQAGRATICGCSYSRE